MDVHSKETRSYNMSRIKGNNTKPEELVRKYLFSQGFRYRKNDKRLPGTPDIVLPKYKTVIFVNGCFWHGHEGCDSFKMPKTNTDFWEKKIRRNKQRDIDEQRQIASMGWHCITIWECQLKPHCRQQTLASLAQTLYRIYLADNTVRHYRLPDSEEIPMAAEPTPEK